MNPKDDIMRIDLTVSGVCLCVCKELGIVGHTDPYDGGTFCTLALIAIRLVDALGSV